MHRLIAILLGLGLASTLRAENSVNWEMTPRVAGPGQPFRIQIRIASENTLHTPKNVAKELKPPRGMALSFSGQGYLTANEAILNFSGVAPETEGVFVIPSFPLRFATQIIVVPDIPVHVSKSTGYRPELLAHAELLIPDRTYYVGELIRGSINLRNGGTETVVASFGFESEAEGCTFQLTSDRSNTPLEGEQGLQTTFELTPIRAGSSEVALRGIMLVQSGANPVFNNAGRDRPFAFRRRIAVEHVPERGRPADWSGAIGRFTAESTLVTNERPEVGEPIRLRAILTGTGNLDRIVTPELPTSDAWDILPAVERRQKAEDQRVFAYTLVPRLPGKHLTPVIRFSSFDPETKKYTRLEFPRQEITVTGNAPAKVDLVTVDPAAPLAAKTAVAGLASPRPQSGGRRLQGNGPLVPLAASRSFWQINVFALAGLLGLAAILLALSFLAARPEIVRRWRARRRIRHCLAVAAAARRRGDTRGHAHSIQQGLQTGCAALLDAEADAMTQSDILRVLPAAPRDLLDRIFNAADGAKFGERYLPSLAEAEVAADRLLRELQACL